MTDTFEQIARFGRRALIALVGAALLIPAHAGAADKSSPVLSVKIRGDRLVVIAIRAGGIALDGTFESRSGQRLVFEAGQLVKATDAKLSSRRVETARIDASGRLVIGSGKAEWKVEEGAYMKQQGGSDPRPQPEPQPPNPQGFKVKDGKIVEVTYEG